MPATETIAGRYELLSVLGRGGMGVVYRGRDRVLDRIVAVKVLPAAYASDEILVQRFEREARAAASLNHPNIVAVFDTGRDGTVRYIVMECVAGESLGQRLAERGALPAPDAVEIAAQIADALAAAHAAGIVHRDVKPGNVMVQPDGVCKVLDFGIARAVAEAGMTQNAALLGSAPYMAPETALGQTADARSDIYSLGCVLYEMITGQLPFHGEVPAAVINQHVSAIPRRPSELAPGLAPALDALVMEMLAKDPAERPADAAQTAAALRASLRMPAPATTIRDPALSPTAIAPQQPARMTAPETPPQQSRFPAGLIGVAVLVALLVGIGIALAASSATNDHRASTRKSHTAASSTSSHSTTRSHSQATSTTSTSSSSSAAPSTSTSTTTVTSSPRTSSQPTSSTSATSRSSSSPTAATP